MSTPSITSASEWGRLAREATQKAIDFNKEGQWQFVSSFQKTARHAARMELIMSRRITPAAPPDAPHPAPPLVLSKPSSIDSHATHPQTSKIE